ncbi:GDP-fucose protein O-fucosyltransferase 1-like isoform X2 [Convolutriloba macropyga]|uniref:GDP-fucose protein O-fucosyltransferase 1-like isoform X2 n=1 Tax=Convolutriloba macropyga TaxID=536237 RepID=UPI003F524511
MNVFIALFTIFLSAVKCENFLLYCSCAGRIGNQLDHLLGTIEFAQSINYTLVLMPFVHYYPLAPKGTIKLTFYEEIFNVDSFNSFTDELKPYRVITLELICISNNTGFKNYVMPCELPNYLPYNSYWNLLGVSFAGTGRFVSVDALTGRKSEETTVALLKQPGMSPAKQHQHKYQAYLSWSEHLRNRMSPKVPKRPFAAVHIRIARDMKTACSSIERNPSLFAFEQCKLHKIEPIQENCVPSTTTIYENIKRIIETDDLAAVYLATDSYETVAQGLLPSLKLKFPRVQFLLDKEATEFGDLFLMEQSDVFLGSCVSTYSAFGTRQRMLTKKPVDFIQVPKNSNISEYDHSEL